MTTFKPYNRRRLPRLTDDQIRTIASGYLDAKDREPDVSHIPSDFDYYRKYEHMDRRYQLIERKQQFARNADRLHHFLSWVKLWNRKTYTAADAKPIRLHRSLFDD